MEVQKVKLTETGDLVVEEKANGGGIVQRIKYGLIRIRGEKETRRISYNTLLRLDKATEAGFNGRINITELNIRIPLSEIVFQQIEEERRIMLKDFAKLPTETMDFEDTPEGEPLKPTKESIFRLREEGKPYWSGSVHYATTDGVKKYYLNFDEAQILMRMVPQKGYNHAVGAIYRYGEKQGRKEE